ncbi:hypothetical protein HA402_009847 [Bradysia odoriphaga]|nr:hypothetical protein HA402_009847 [Bradysia odoriphaga]
MKVDQSRLKKGTSEVPPECQQLIDKLRTCSSYELLCELSKIETWTYGKSELYHWIDVLDIFDGIMEDACKICDGLDWCLACDQRFNRNKINLLLSVLNFTTLLIEHSFSRHLYSSVDHLTTLLSSSNMEIVLSVLNLLYMFSKRSNFIPRLNSNKRNALLSRLTYIAESWGGKERGYGLADCCNENMNLPKSSSTFYYEYYDSEGVLKWINPELLVKYSNHKGPGEIAYLMCSRIHVTLDEHQKMLIFTRIRLALSFHKYHERLQFVLARLQALSVLVYSNSLQENVHNLLYPGFLEELVELLEMKQPDLMEIRAAALRTLTSIIHLDRNPHFPKKPGTRLNMIIDVTGASSYHGFLPTLVRTCIQYLTTADVEESNSLFPLPLATALFSFLYHLASYDSGGEALVACGMMESLLCIINWPGSELEHITFVTRAVRVIDLITNIEMQSFQNHGGLDSFIRRLDMEVNICRKEQPFEIKPQLDRPSTSGDADVDDGDEEMSYEETEDPEATSQSSSAGGKSVKPELGSVNAADLTKTCLPQRAALLKSKLNFLKKAIQDSAFSESIRHVMEGTLPSSLRHIISNAEYYGPSLFLLATDVVTVYVFQEPSLLFALQDNGLTDVVLQALLRKDVPATREVLGSLPNVFSALCLNARGLAAFAKYCPFDKLFQVLLSPVYLPAMRRRRSSDPMGDTASNLGNAMDELMRHQPSLKTEATKAIIRLLQELVKLGTDPKYICWRAQGKNETSPTASNSRMPGTESAGNDGGSSDEEDDDEESTSSHHNQQRDVNTKQESTASSVEANERTPIPLIDYILNVMKFVDAILSNNSTDDHCREFVLQGGLKPLLQILSLPNLPVDCPITASAQAVAAVCKSILNLAHEPQVLQVGLEQLAHMVDQLRPLQSHWHKSRGSVLLRELANCPNIDGAFSNAAYTPLLHGMSAVHGYVVMLVHVCRTGQNEIRNLSIQKWGQDNQFGLKLLYKLVQLYTALVWESTLLLALCTDDIIPEGCDFGREDMDKLTNVIFDVSPEHDSDIEEIMDENSMDIDKEMRPFNLVESMIRKKRIVATESQLKYIKSLLGASSRLGRALAELFGLLVKLCVSTPRRPQNVPTNYMSLASKDIARVLSYILVDGLSHDQLPSSPISKLKQTFLICSIGFTSPMLFDEKRYAYHLILHKFVQEGGLNAFFEMFNFALNSNLDKHYETIDAFPEGTGEFLDAWLMLLEKMVNPKAILESPHVITLKSSSRAKEEFDAINYLINVHRKAFLAVTKIWKIKPISTYGQRMTESMLTILKHIFKGEKTISAKYLQKQTAANVNVEKPSSSTTTPQTTTALTPSSNAAATEAMSPLRSVNRDHLQQLMDMGFSYEDCREALYFSTSVEQATEYLLAHAHAPGEFASNTSTPNTPSAPSTSAAMNSMFNSSLISIDSDEEEMLQLSTPDVNSIKKVRRGMAKTVVHLPNDPPLCSRMLTRFSDEAVQTCLFLIDQVPDTVFKGTELLVILFRRNSVQWRTAMLTEIVKTLVDGASKIRKMIKEVKPSDINVDELFYGEMASQFNVRLHIFSLFLDGQYTDLRIPAIVILTEYKLVHELVHLLFEIERILAQCDIKASGSPKWLAQMILLIDLFEKVALYTQRKAEMHAVTSRVWKWYEVATGKWNAYTVQNNKIINDAYWAGESSVRLNVGRNRYTINFNCMSQVNEESGNHRPVILALLKSQPKKVSDSLFTFPGPETDECVGAPTVRFEPEMGVEVGENGEIVKSVKEAQPPDWNHRINGLEDFDTTEIVYTCVRLMSPNNLVDRDSLHALMRFCVRLTTKYENAEMFARAGGVKLLLEMKQTCGYIGFSTLANLLIRHTLEEPQTLKSAMEKVIAARTVQNIPPGYRELVFMLRRMSSAVSRDPSLFRQVAESMLRIDRTAFHHSGLSEDNRLIMKSIVPNDSSQQTPTNVDDTTSKQVIHDLLEALVVITPSESTTASTKEARSSHHHHQSHQEQHTHQHLPFHLTTQVEPDNHFQHRRPFAEEDDNQQNLQVAAGSSSDAAASSSVNQQIKDGKCTWNITCTKGDNDKPLLPKSTILKALAEAVRSFPAVGVIIAEFIYKPNPNTMVKVNGQTALAFILDKLLPPSDANPDRDCNSAARMLIASMSSATDSNLAQFHVVNEVKLAIKRALAWPEIAEKHQQLQLLTGLIPTMIENCPPDNPSLLKIHQYQPRRNDIFHIMVNKGLIADLSKITQSLDLSSTHTISTINAVLKPLETLLRMANQPGPAAAVPKKSLCSVHRSPATLTTDAENVSPVLHEFMTERQRQETEEGEQQQDGSNAEETFASRSGQLRSGLEARIQAIGRMEDLLDHFLEREQTDSSFTENELNGNFAMNEPLEMSSDSDDSDDSNATEIEEGEVEVEENEDEADDRSELDVDEETRQFIEIYDMHGRRMSPSIPELDRDNEDILMIQYSGSENGAGDGNANHGDVTGENSSGDAETTDDGISGIAAAANEVVAAAVRTSRGNGEGSSGENSSNPNRFILHANFIQNRSSSSRGQVNAGDGSAFANGGEGSSSSIGMGSSTTATSAATSMATRLQAITSHRSHLSTSSQSQQPQTLAMRARRTTRRGRGYHYINLNTRSSNPPVILQRLLGPGAQNIGRGSVAGIGSVSLATGSNGINSNSNGVNQVNAGSSTFRDATRVVVMDNGFGIFTNNEEGGSIDLVDQAGFLFGRSLAATLNNTPSALHWWLEEAKVLGLESQSDVCLTVCNSLIPDLEAQRSLELSQMRNGKRKKRQTDQKSSQAKKHHHEEQFSANERLEVQQEESVLSNYGAEGTNLNASTQIEVHATDLEEGDVAANRMQDEVVDNDSDSMSSGQASIILEQEQEQDTTMNVVPAARDDCESETEVRSQSQMSQSSSLTMSSSPISPNEGTSDSVADQQPDASNIASGSGTSTDATKDKEIATSDDDESPKNKEASLATDEHQANTSTRNIQDGKVCDPDSSSNASEEDNAVVSTKIDDQDPENRPSKSVDANISINVDDSDDDCCVVETGSAVASNASNQGGSSNQLPMSSTSTAQPTEPLPRPPGLNGPVIFGPFDATTPYSIPWPNTQEPFHTSSGPFGPYGPYPLREATPARNTETTSETMTAVSQEATNQSLPSTNTVADQSQNPPVESRSVAESLSEAVPIDIEEGDNEDEDYEDVADEQDEDDNEEENDANDEEDEDAAVSNAPTTETAAATADSAFDAIPEIPDGVDPSFLAALPQEMREEVLAEHNRQQRVRQRAQQNAIESEHASVSEVNPEFLAALPPNIQEEVLAQQRMEQRRQAAAAANPEDPVDPAEFFQNLQPSLRQQILADMEDSQISVLPPELAAEAQNLRRELESRTRANMQPQSQIGNVQSYPSVLRYRSRLPEPIFTSHNLQPMRFTNWGCANSSDNGPSLMTMMERQGRRLLDHESLASLLILMFLDEQKFNSNRLQRVIRNLCYHVPTRDWIINALLSIIERSNESTENPTSQDILHVASRPLWLNIRLDAALGARNNVFIIKRDRDTISDVDGGNYEITIHVQAAQIICRHALDLLILLSKSFPVNFLPRKSSNTLKATEQMETSSKAGPSSSIIASSNSQAAGPSSSRTETQETQRLSKRKSTDFWNILMHLESTAQQRKFNPGNCPKMSEQRESVEPESTSFSDSPFGQLVSMLSFSIVKKSSQLTDKLLRLLSFISVGLPENKDSSSTENATTNSRAGDSTSDSKQSETSLQQTEEQISEYDEIDESILPESETHLRLAIDVLTSKSCSEEGLEDATLLLLNLSQCSNRTRTLIIELLISGATYLAKIVKQQIKDLMNDLQLLNRTNKVHAVAQTLLSSSIQEPDLDASAKSLTAKGSSGPSTAAKGILQDRFTKETVVITSPNKQKTTCELQLPSMVPLISKTSSQSFFLRTLKVIIQIREAVREALDKESATVPASGASTDNNTGRGTSSTSSTAATVAKATHRRKIVLSPGELSSLSDILQLDELWDTLSTCLIELEATADHHAVLILQPAVEAFFLVHATQQSKPATTTTTNTTAAASEVPRTVPQPVSSANSDVTPSTPEIPIAPPETTSESAADQPMVVAETTQTTPSTSQQEEPSVTSEDNAATLEACQAALRAAGRSSSSQASAATLTPDQLKFLQFAEKHRTVLNQILRQSTTHLSDGPFAVLVDHTRILDFDVKRRYFRTELDRMDEGIRREELAVHVHRVTVFEDSFREMYRRNSEDWKNRFYIVFEDEEGQDAGGLLREWYVIISREIFNPMYALFTVSPGDRVTYMINPSSHANPNHLLYFQFVGRVIAKAIYDNKLLESYFTRSFYKHILGIEVNTQDMESEDYEFYKGLVFLMENHVSALGYEQTFSLEVQEFGVTEVRDLIPNGRNIVVTEENKFGYIHLVCQLKMSGSIKQQLNAFLEGFYDIIPKRLISIFNEQELELLISGLPNVDIEDLKANTEYHKYQANSIQIQWFWRALRSFDQADRAKFLQFVTGTSKVPLQGFGALEGMNGTQKFQIHRDDRSTERLPSAHTCFNQLDLPVYKTYDKLRSSLLKAIHECSEGFGFA